MGTKGHKMRFLAGAAVAMLSLASAENVWAQTDTPAPAGGDSINNDHDIIVTAQRRSESLQNAAVTVQAVSADELQSRSITNLMDLQRVNPSLTVQSAGGVNVSPFLRGIGSSIAGAGLFGSVSIYEDGVYKPGVFHGSFDVDLAEGIQILSGPQGTLYGRNATGGAIIVTNPSAMPGDPLSMRARISYGNYDAVNALAQVKGSIGDVAGIYIGAAYHKHDGYAKNLNSVGYHQNDINDRNSWQIQGALTLQPTERFTLTVRGAHFEKFDAEGQNSQAVGLDIRPASLGGLNGNQAYYAGTLSAFGVPPATAFAIGSNLAFSGQYNATYDILKNGFESGVLSGKYRPGAFLYQRYTSGSVRADLDLDFATISSLTAYQDALTNGAADLLHANPATLPAGFPNGIGFTGAVPQKSFQQELQLTSRDGAPFEWTAGLVYYRVRGENITTGDFPFGSSFILSDNVYTVVSKAAFVQAKYALTDQLAVTGGLRYTDEDYKLVDRFDPSNPFALPGAVNLGTQRLGSSKLTYTARVEYDNGPVLLYASLISGFKAATLVPVTTANPPVDAETITSYEAGFKWTIAPSTTFNGAVFHYDYNDIQLAYTDTATGANVQLNGPGASIWGGEAQLNVALTNWLTARVSGFVLDAKYDGNVVNTGSQPLLVIKDNRLAGAPKYGVTGGIDWTAPIGTLALSGSVNVSHSSGYYFESENLIGTGGANADSFTTVDASIGIGPEDGRYKLSLFANNLFDQKYFVSGLAASGILRTASAAAPRTYGLALDLKF